MAHHLAAYWAATMVEMLVYLLLELKLVATMAEMMVLWMAAMMAAMMADYLVAMMAGRMVARSVDLKALIRVETTDELMVVLRVYEMVVTMVFWLENQKEQRWVEKMAE